MSTNYWVQFFKDAGIPSSVAKSYALIFEDNRITRDMLLDLNKDILNDMGIKVMGDVISVLKHAKQVHSQESRRKDLGGGGGGSSSKSAPSSSSVKIPAAHSTSPGLAAPAAVSTTTSTGRRTKHLVVSEEPADSWTSDTDPQEEDELTLAEGEGSSMDVATLEALLSHPTLRSDRMVLEAALAQSGLLDAESTPPPPTSAPDPHTGYSTSPTRRKRPHTMYSDDPTEYSSSKQPRVVVLPNKDQDIYTTTALRKAVATVTALGAAATAVQEISPSEHQSPERLSQRRLLEATGLLEPQREKSHSSASSVFSRLDNQKPTTTTTTTTNIRLPGGVSKPTARVTLDTSKPRTVSDVTFPSSSSSHAPPSLRITTKPVLQSQTTSASVGRLSGRLGAKKENSSRITSSSSSSLQIGGGTLISDRLASKLGAPARSKERLGVREKEVSSSTSFSGGGGTVVGTKLSGRLGARAKDLVTGSIRPASSKKPQQQQVPVSTQHSMVADEYEYQTLRQLDVRSRLERKERETRARRGGPLAGRLAKHDVFGRLE